MDDTKISSKSSGTNRFIPSNRLGVAVDFAGDEPGFSNIAVKNEVDLYQVNLLASKEYAFGETGILEPFAGMNISHMKQDESLKLFKDDLSRIYSSDMKQSYTAFSPMVGLQGQYKIFKDLFL